MGYVTENQSELPARWVLGNADDVLRNLDSPIDMHRNIVYMYKKSAMLIYSYIRMAKLGHPSMSALPEHLSARDHNPSSHEGSPASLVVVIRRLVAPGGQ